jgi:hypothetical protein
MKVYFFLLIIVVTVISCKTDSTNKVLPSYSTIVLFGYDSIGFYSTPKPQLSGVLKGNLHDSAFISTIIDTLKNYSSNKFFYTIIKPTASANIAEDFKRLVDILNENEIVNRKIDSLNSYEETLFMRNTFPDILGEAVPMKLNLPKGDDGDIEKINRDKSITLILAKNDMIYAYKGKSPTAIKKFTYQSIRNYIIENKNLFINNGFTMIIKPSEEASYKNTIDILDEMSINTIEKYAVVDISKEEIALLKSLD